MNVCAVVDPIGILGHSPLNAGEKGQIESARSQAERVVQDAVKEALAAGIVAEGCVLVGEPAREIVHYAFTAAADAIVLGTHGRSGFKRLFMGSVAEAVLRTASCPVMVVREKARVVNPPEPSRIGDGDQPVFSVRLVQLEPGDFERLYGEIASFMQGPGSELPGCLGAQVFGSEDAARILIVAEFRSHADWSRAQWDARLGELLEEIVASSTTLDYNLYRGDRFPITKRA